MILHSCSDDISPDNIESYEFIPIDPIINVSSNYMIVIGDIQEYTNNCVYLPYLNYSLDWIRNQNNMYNNIVSVLQVGDVTNNNQKHQWDNARNAFKHLKDSVMYVWCIGNHDYSWSGEKKISITSRESSMLNKYVSNPLLNNNIVDEFEKDHYDNIIVKNTVGDQRIDIISLEFGPRPDVVQWVTDHVSRHIDRKYILMTHEYMTNEGTLYQSGETFANLQFFKIPFCEPEFIWDNLVKPNDNIICVINGHNGFCKYLESKNNAGRMVPQIMFNLQYQENGGDSMIQLWEFPKDKNEIIISVYNTMKRIEVNPTEYKYSFTY